MCDILRDATTLKECLRENCEATASASDCANIVHCASSPILPCHNNYLSVPFPSRAYSPLSANKHKEIQMYCPPQRRLWEDVMQSKSWTLCSVIDCFSLPRLGQERLGWPFIAPPQYVDTSRCVTCLLCKDGASVKGPVKLCLLLGLIRSINLLYCLYMDWMAHLLSLLIFSKGDNASLCCE